MSFDHGDIRKAMDVYTSDNVYLGPILEIRPGQSAEPEDPLVAEDARQMSVVNGEMMGPMPTRSIGNPGPLSQSASARYATDPDAAALGRGAIVIGKWWGLAGKRTIPLEAVQTVSLERVVLRAPQSELGSILR